MAIYTAFCRFWVLLARCSGLPCGLGRILMLLRSRLACRSGPAGGGWLIVAG